MTPGPLSRAGASLNGRGSILPLITTRPKVTLPLFTLPATAGWGLAPADLLAVSDFQGLETVPPGDWLAYLFSLLLAVGAAVTLPRALGRVIGAVTERQWPAAVVTVVLWLCAVVGSVLLYRRFAASMEGLLFGSLGVAVLTLVEVSLVVLALIWSFRASSEHRW